MAMSQKELNNYEGGYNYTEIDEAIENERNREKSIQEKVYDLEEFMVIEDEENIKNFKPQNFKTDKEWQEYYNYLESSCKLNRLKQHLKIINRICEDCGKKLKYCTCKCNDCGKVGSLNCDCLPF